MRFLRSGLAAALVCTATAAFAASPDSFTFVKRTGVTTNAIITSEGRTITGTGPFTVSVTQADGAQYSIAGGAYTSAPGTIDAGQTLSVRHRSATSASTSVVTVVTVGDYATNFESVTGTADRTPDPFGFATQTGLEPGATATSNTITLSGYNTSVAVSVSPGAQYSIAGGAFTSASGMLGVGQTLTLRHVANSQLLGYTKSTVTVGGIAGTFTTRTRGSTPPPPPDSDADGVEDSMDQCPGTPAGETVHFNGCSDSQLDSDHDGVSDAADQCPETPPNSMVDSAGCVPPPPPPADSDADGVPDASDDCPGSAPGAAVDASGCAASQRETSRSPDASALCAGFGVPGSSSLCAGVRAAEDTLRDACGTSGAPAGACTLADGNLHAVIDACNANDPSDGQFPACRVIDAFVTGAAAYCRQVSNATGGAQPPELCALLGGVLVSEGALKKYEGSWVHKALLLQNRLGYRLPLAQNTLLHTHNSFNATDDNTPPTPSGSDFNQYYDIPSQLRMDIRAVEMDVHWMPGRGADPAAIADGATPREPMLCHGEGPGIRPAPDPDQANLGCSYEKPLRDGLKDFRAWLDAHPDEMVMLYIEDNLGGSQVDEGAAYAATAQVVRDEIGDRVFGPGEHGSTCNNAQPAGTTTTSWLNVTRQQVLDAGKQVLLITENCRPDGSDGWNALFHQKNDRNWVQGTQSSFDGFAYDTCRMPDDASFMNARRAKFTRVWEDSTVVTATAGGGAPAAVTPEVMRELMRCGMSLPGVDRLVPEDGRLEAAVWSWAPNQPVASDTLNCAALNASGRFFAASCDERRPYACVSDADPDQWQLGGGGPWSGGATGCPAGTHFSVPSNGFANEHLKAAAGGLEAWLNYSDAGADGRWRGDAAAEPAAAGTFTPASGIGALCRALGGPEALCGALDTLAASANALYAQYLGPDPNPGAALDPAIAGCRDSGVPEPACSRIEDLARHGAGLSRWVDPRIGGVPPGFTNPGPTAPYGMVQPGPDTEGPVNFGGYYSHNSLIMGFAQVHMSAGVYKAGYIPVMPVTGNLETGTGDVEQGGDHPLPAYSSPFDHATEVAEAGYYAALLSRYQVLAELTATERVAFHRYTFGNPGIGGKVVVDVSRTLGGYNKGGARQVAPNRLTGYVHDGDAGGFEVWFALEADRPFTAKTFGGAAVGAALVEGDKLGVVLDPGNGAFSGALNLKVAISYTDEAGALANLDDAAGVGFDAARAATLAKWDDALQRVEVEGGTYGDRIAFYTALYHAQQFPNVHSDVDGRYRGPDHQVYRDAARPHYSQFSSWDSYRAQNQLQAEIVPGLYDDMIQSLVAFGRQNGGVMPRWQQGPGDASHMTGDPIIPFIGEAWCRGQLSPATRDQVWPLLLNLPEHRDGFLRANGYEAVEPVQTFGDTGVAPVDEAQKLLYEAQDIGDPTGGAAASATLEYGIADFSLALMAQSVPGADAGGIAQRSLNYRKLFDPVTKWIRPRNADGSWMTPFAPEVGYGFQEGTSWQYSWMSMHDYAGVIDRMGGADAANQRLDIFFNFPASSTAPIVWPALQNQATLFGISYAGNQYAPGNEHDLEAPYVYNYTGQAWKTGAVVRAAASIYTPTPAGMPGNDDLGALSGSLVWNMAGVYPINPGTPLFTIGSPVFTKVTFHRPGGDFVIEAPGASVADKYVQSTAVNGVPSDKTWFVLPRAATTVRIDLAAAPNTDWGLAQDARPPSLSTRALSAFGCGNAPALAGDAPRVDVSRAQVTVSSAGFERTWSRAPFRTTRLVDTRNGKVWSEDSADFSLTLGGAEVSSGQFSVVGEPVVRREANGCVRTTFTLAPAGFGALPVGFTVTRAVTACPGVAGMRSETWLNSIAPVAISGYTLDESRPQGQGLNGTIHSFRAGSDWREPTWTGPASPAPPFPAPVIGDPHAGDWRASQAGYPVSGTAQWLSVSDAQDRRLFYVLERNDYASSMMTFDSASARAHVDLSRDVIYLGPVEESGHVGNPGPGPARSRVVLPGQPLRLEPVFTGFGLDGDDEPWQHYKYLANYRMPPYRREVTFNSNGVDSNRISTGAKDDMDIGETRRQAAVAQQIGVETFILDDGWQARSGDWCPDSDGASDGVVDPACTEPRRADGSDPRITPRFHDSTFSEVRDVLADAGGMKLGLWMSPLHFNDHAVAFQQNPQWACMPIDTALLALQKSDPYGGSQEAGLLQWNLAATGPEGRADAYLENRIRRAIDVYGSKYFKFDFTAWLDCGGPGATDMYGYRELFVDMLDRILRDHPDVTIAMDETNDYRLFPFEALARGPTWYQNGSPNTSEALHANQVLAPYVPLYALGRNALSVGRLGTDSADYQMAVALLSHVTFFNSLTSIPESVRPAVKRWTDYFKAHREDLAQFAYPLTTEDALDPAHWAAFQAWNPETGRGALLVYRQDAVAATKTVRLRNVPAGAYRLYAAPDDTAVGDFTAAQLRGGIDINVPAKRSAQVLRIERR